MQKHEGSLRCEMYDVRCASMYDVRYTMYNVENPVCDEQCGREKNNIRINQLLFYVSCFMVCMLPFSAVSAQKANKSIQQGNEAYRKADFSTAIKDYSKALSSDDKNEIAKFNMANAYHHSNDAHRAMQAYDDVTKSSVDAGLQSKAYYNKALSLLQQKNLAGAIDAFKQSLRLMPNDNDTRENLQKAMEEMKQQQQSQPQPQNQKQPPPQQQPKKQKQQKMNQQMMEQKFKELQEQEKQLQKELQKQKTNQPDPEKDW